MDLLYITKIVSKEEKEIYLYISLYDFKMHTFTKKNNDLIYYNDKNLLDVLNNVSGTMYRKYDEKQSNKPKSALKQKLQKALAVLGVGVVILSVEPAAVELVGYSLKTLNGTSYSGIVSENTTTEDFINQFSIAINKNEDYEEFEKYKIIEGFTKYFNDWGYLLDEQDKKYILHMIETVNINRNIKLPRWAAASYALGNISTKEGEDRTSNISHETCHALSDRGLAIGTTNGLGFGYAVNEGINATVNDVYYTKDSSYYYYRQEALKLSLIVGSEVLVETYQKEGPQYLCSVMANQHGINYFDAIKYISMLDLILFLDDYKMLGDLYSLPSSFYKEKDELYNKMFRQKYNYDFSETVFATSTFEEVNFLKEEAYICTKINNQIKHIVIPQPELAKRKEELDLEKYIVPNIGILHELLAPNGDIIYDESKSWDALCSYVVGGEYDQETYDKVKDLYSSEVNKDNFETYMELLNNKILNSNSTPEYTACYIKYVLERLKQNKLTGALENKFNKSIIETLESNGMIDALDLYQNSTIEFESYNWIDPSASRFVDEYKIMYEIKDKFLTPDGSAVARLGVEEDLWSASYGGEHIWVDYFYESDYIKYNITPSADYKYFELSAKFELSDLEQLKVVGYKQIKINNQTDLLPKNK